jgi:glycogen debranching enzyme
MQWVIRPLLLLSFVLAHTHSVSSQSSASSPSSPPSPSSPSQSDYAAPIMAGISDQGGNQNQPYVTAGDRAYLIGTQDGNFPDLGSHVPGEMAGLWLHPIKLIDGFWATVTDRVTNQVVALSRSTACVTYPYGSRFSYAPVLDSLQIERFQFSPDGQEGVIVQYQVRNAGDRKRQLLFQFAVKTELSPVWYSERLGIKDARDTVTWNAGNHVFIANDAENQWFAVWGAAGAGDAQPIPHPDPIQTKGMGTTAATRYGLSLQPRGTSTLTFVLAGSAKERKAALDTYSYLAANQASLLEEKKAHYASLIDRARVRIPDQHWQEVYNWVRVNAEWLVREVPGIGRGLGAGLMEYPWWFGTETYSLQALMASGNFDLAKQTLRLLNEQSIKANGNGRIVHEVTTNGAVSNPGNSQETAQWILTVGRLIDWTGDLELAKEMYPAMKQGIHWLLTDMDQNHDLFPEGYGIMEVYGLNAELIDVAVYTQQALKATAHIAGVLNQPDTAARYQALASQLEKRINQRFWIEREGSYADFYGSRAQAISAAEGAIKQIGLGGASLTRRDQEMIGYYERLKQRISASPDSSRGWSTNKNWVITTPMEVGIAPRVRAIRALDQIRKANVGEYGPFLSAVERQAMMTISTGVQAVSEGNYGRTEQALWYVDKIVQTFNRVTPGSISEMMPDYGCFTIAWTSYGIVVPLVQHVFGIQPDALNQTVVFEPHVPDGWEEMSIEDLPVGTTKVSFSRGKTAKGIEYRFEAKDDGWQFVFKGKPLPRAKYFLNGKPVAFTSAGIRMSGKKNELVEVSR